MHKSIALIGLFLLSNSVLAPTTANAQTIATSSITASTTAQPGMTTTQNQGDLQELGVPTLSVTLTSYNAVPAQTKADPYTTSIGVFSNPQVIAARSNDLADKLPYGTIIAIDGPAATGGGTCGYSSVQQLIGYRVIGDAMNARMHNKVDVLLNQHDTVPMNGEEINPSVALGACTGVTIRVVGFVSPYNMPKTQAELAAIVESSQHLASAQF